MITFDASRPKLRLERRPRRLAARRRVRRGLGIVLNIAMVGVLIGLASVVGLVALLFLIAESVI